MKNFMNKLGKKIMDNGMWIFMAITIPIALLDSCVVSNDDPPTTLKVSKSPLKTEFLGIVGNGETNEFSLYRFEVDGVTYLVGCDYNTGIGLIDKIEDNSISKATDDEIITINELEKKKYEIELASLSVELALKNKQLLELEEKLEYSSY